VAGGLELPGTLHVPPGATGIEVLTHGSGSSRLSPRNVAVGSTLNAGGEATLARDQGPVGELEPVTRAHEESIKARDVGRTGPLGPSRSPT
jgi:hypothetical protein